MLDHVGVQTYKRDAFDLDTLVELKRTRSRHSLPSTVSVVLPMRNCERTIGDIVRKIRIDLMEKTRLVDEILVVDHDSTDSSARRAARAGATVLPFATTAPITDLDGLGKGSVMRKGVQAAKGDFIVFADADHTKFDSFKVWRLIGPLLSRSDVVLVKAYYEGYPGGRTTEAMARPVISLLHPELAALQQPLSGEQAGLRSVFTAIRFPHGWGTEYRILDQVARRYGASRIAQVDVEYKEHESGDSRHINRQAFELLHAALRSAFAEAGLAMPADWGRETLMPGPEVGTVVSAPTRTQEWPPLDGEEKVPTLFQAAESAEAP